jgi:hypothetical protein
LTIEWNLSSDSVRSEPNRCFQRHRFQPSHRSQGRVARLEQIAERLNEFDLGLDHLSLRIENVQKALLAEALLLSNASHGGSVSRGRIAPL